MAAISTESVIFFNASSLLLDNSLNSFSLPINMSTSFTINCSNSFLNIPTSPGSDKEKIILSFLSFEISTALLIASLAEGELHKYPSINT